MVFKKMAVIAASLAALAAFSIGNVAAQDVDLTDNATCFECHEGGGSDDPMEVEGARIHNADGSFTVEAHEMWSCVDCHADIAEIPHNTEMERTVDCLQCHEEVPQAE